MSKIIAIDFDNTLFKTDWPDILEPIWGVIERAKEEQRNGAKLILWTCRCGKYLDEAVEVCRAFGLIFDAVNENLPESIETFDGSDSRKVFAHEYWDDLAINPSELYKHTIGKFSTYAVPCIANQIKMELRKMGRKPMTKCCVPVNDI